MPTPRLQAEEASLSSADAAPCLRVRGASLNKTQSPASSGANMRPGEMNSGRKAGGAGGRVKAGPGRRRRRRQRVSNQRRWLEPVRAAIAGSVVPRSSTACRRQCRRQWSARLSAGVVKRPFQHPLYVVPHGCYRRSISAAVPRFPHRASIRANVQADRVSTGTESMAMRLPRQKYRRVLHGRGCRCRRASSASPWHQAWKAG